MAIRYTRGWSTSNPQQYSTVSQNGTYSNLSTSNNGSSGTVIGNSVVGTYHIAESSKLFEVQRPNNFEFLINDLDGLTFAGMDNVTDQTLMYARTAEESLRLTVFSSSIPHFEQEAIKIKMGNNEMKFAGTPTFGSGSLKVYDTIGPDSKGILMAWQNMSYNVSTEKVGLARDYKKTAYLIEYTPDWQQVRKWKLTGCWISKLSESDSDWTGNGYKTVDVTIEYDKAELDSTDIY